MTRSETSETPNLVSIRSICSRILPVSILLSVVTYYVASTALFRYDQHLSVALNQEYIRAKAAQVDAVRQKSAVKSFEISSVSDAEPHILMFYGDVDDRGDYLDLRAEFSDADQLKFRPVWLVNFSTDVKPQRSPQFAKVTPGSARAMYIRGTIAGILTGTVFAVSFFWMSMRKFSQFEQSSSARSQVSSDATLST